MSNKEWLSDPYVTEWLSKVGERTKKNYIERYPKWLAFIQMTPTEQYLKRCEDTRSNDPKVRGFFEDKVVEFKNTLVAQNYKPSSISCTLTPVLSFFSAHRVPLRFKRKELKVETRTEDKVIREWIPDNTQAKQIYQHGDTRDRPLFLCLYQSGFSETDVSSLNVEDLPNIEQHEGHYQISMYREKTDVLQRTCLSEECVHDIKEMIKERRHSGTLKPDSNGKTPLFISQKGERLSVRFINDAIKAMVEKTYGKEKADEFKTKSLRDAYNDALLRANLTQEIKDTLFGHKREGAREKYAISQATIIDAYTKAHQFLTVNHGTQARKDIEVIRDQMREMRDNSDKTLANLNRVIENQQKLMDDQQKRMDEMANTQKKQQEDYLRLLQGTLLNQIAGIVREGEELQDRYESAYKNIPNVPETQKIKELETEIKTIITQQTTKMKTMLAVDFMKLQTVSDIPELLNKIKEAHDIERHMIGSVYKIKMQIENEIDAWKGAAKQ